VDGTTGGGAGHELARLGLEEAGARLDERTIALLPVGSIQPHGPHLPLDTDTVLARARALRAAELFAERGARAVVLPALGYGVSRLAQDFRGGVTLRPGTLWGLIEDLAISLQQDGLRQLVLVNMHHEAEHLRTLTNLAVDLAPRGPGRCQVLFPDAPELGGPLLEEVDCLGGRRETGLMLAVAPDLVDEEVRRGLPAVEVVLPPSEPGRSRSLRELGAPRAYAGAPAEASAQEGSALLEALAGAVVERCARAWPELFGVAPA
jgi:creatinine amidohydrolase